MFGKLKISDDEKIKAGDFVQWCIENKKDLLKMAFDGEYMQEIVNEYEGGIKNEN